MQERADLTVSKINHDLLWFVMRAPWWFWVAVVALGLFVGAYLYSFAMMLNYGIGVLGINRPIMWGFLITNFVFWVGISHAGVMISAILRLTQAEWRRPVTRAAEVLTVFSLATAATFPLVHTGRPWRALYWIFPYDFSRGIWPDVRSALIWDPSAIFTYLTSSSLFVYIALIPDLALARDRSTGWKRKFYGILALGFRGNVRQWRLQTIAGILLSALILPIFVSVHSIVSWDFGMAMAAPAWHATIFAPYFVIGAVHSGVSAVATLMAILRKVFKLQDYITPDHFDALGRLLLVVSNVWFYFFLLDFIFGVFTQEPAELAVMNMRVFQYPYNLLSVIFLLTGYFIPVPLWLFRRVRRNVAAMFWTSILVNVGMWLERFLIVVPGLTLRGDLSFNFGEYGPALPEYGLVIGSFGIVALGILVFSKFFPIIPAFDIKEGQVIKAELAIGRRKVPGIMHEE
jgi:molybdopterin-containing oxidoreductase family membrane subunit